MALISDLCKVYTGDIISYDGLLPERKRERYEFVKKWPPRASKKEKEEKWREKLIKKIKFLTQYCPTLKIKLY